MTPPTILDQPSDVARPRLAPGVRLKNDPVRGTVLLAPERIVRADAIASAILTRCTGERTLGDIIDDLAATHAAPRERIAGDVRALLLRLAQSRLVDLGEPR